MKPQISRIASTRGRGTCSIRASSSGTAVGHRKSAAFVAGMVGPPALDELAMHVQRDPAGTPGREFLGIETGSTEELGCL